MFFLLFDILRENDRFILSSKFNFSEIVHDHKKVDGNFVDWVLAQVEVELVRVRARLDGVAKVN